MRIYTCVFEKSGAINIRDISAPWDQDPAVQSVQKELELSENDRLIALIPGQHTRRAWIFKDKPEVVEESAVEKPATPKTHSGISLKDYVPNGF